MMQCDLLSLRSWLVSSFTILLVICFQATGSSFAAEARIWTDSTGKHQIRAKFVDLSDGQVRLERPNGDISKLPLEKLSKADQQIVQDLATKGVVERDQPKALKIGDRVQARFIDEWKPATVVAIDYLSQEVEVHFDSGGSPEVEVANIRWPDGMPAYLGKDPHALPLTPTDKMSAVRVVAEGSPASSLEPDPVSEGEQDWQPRAIRLPERRDFHEDVEDISIAVGERPLAVVLHSMPGAGRADKARVQLLDLARRRVIASGEAPDNTAKVRLSPSGTRIVSIPDDRHNSERGQLDFWKIDENQVSHWISFQPYAPEGWPKRECEWIAWLDDEHFFTTNSDGRLFLWQVDGAKAVYELVVGRKKMPEVSPGREYFAVGTKQGIQFFQATTGDLLAEIGDQDWDRARLAFSPSGDRLAVASGGFLDILDLSTGKVSRSFPCEGANAWSDLTWIDSDYLLVANRDVVDVERRIPIWRIEVGNGKIASARGMFYVFIDNRLSEQILSPLELPPPEAVQAAANLDEQQLLAVKPGAKVSLQMHVNRSGFLDNDAHSAVMQSLEATGFQVVEESPLVLHVTFTHGESEEISYELWGRGRHGEQSFQVTSNVYKLELKLNGQTIWERTSTQRAPAHVRLQRGETIRAAVDRLMKPDSRYFAARLPQYVVKPEYHEPRGTSRSVGR